jgi:hypothetical protein
MRQFLLLSAAAVLLAVGPAAARDPAPSPPPAIVQGLLACRSVTDSAQRLACYDKQSGAVAEALAKRDIVVIDKERATLAKREVFGFSTPSFSSLLGGGPLSEIEGTVAGAVQNGDGGWTIRLSDGSVWQQTDDTPLALEPRHGDKVIVRRGTLGSYFLKLGKQPGFKAKRIA